MLDMIQDELEKRENFSVTENGALGYKSTKSALVDMNYKVSSFRNCDEEEIIDSFDKTYNENREYALKWLFFARDIREGLGERRLFRICYRRLAELDVDLFIKNLYNIAEYGRWDDLVSMIGISHKTDEYIIEIIRLQLQEDLNTLNDNESSSFIKKPISLLAKWMPSENASSKETKKLARKVRKLLKMSSRQYRLMLSKLRKHLNVVEVQMCHNQWESIDYEHVPSLANLKYKNAFDRHDKLRRREYLASVKKGESKLNMGVATPVDIVSRYPKSRWRMSEPYYDEALELAWKNLKDVLIEETLVVADGSGSMLAHVSGNITALDVANALAIYTSEHNSHAYKNKYITFSNKPKFVTFKNEQSLGEKLYIATQHSEVANTNIEAVFDLILDVSIQRKVSKDEMIKNILIISDMEFDSAQRSFWHESNVLTQPLFDEIKERYNKAGYDLPKLIFWNVNSRTKTIPLTENELGVVLVSGFSQNVLKMVMSSKYDPYEVLIDTITAPRYDKIYT